MYNVIYKNKIIAKVGRKSGVGVTFKFPFDVDKGYKVFKIEGNDYHVLKV